MYGNMRLLCPSPTRRCSLQRRARVTISRQCLDMIYMVHGGVKGNVIDVVHS